MYAHIDWISFSVVMPEPPEGGRPAHYMGAICGEALDALDPHLAEALGLEDEVLPVKGRKPYSMGYEAIKTGVRLYCHPNLTHALVEISGQACAKLREADYLLLILDVVTDRVTRVDVAVDMETAVRPSEFASQRDEARFRSVGFQTSESGETVYIGSRTSDRYARVYRYNPPHERSHLLRCEFVLKGMNAKSAVADMVQGGVDAFAAGLGKVFAWQHPTWRPADIGVEAPPAYRKERREGKTLFWLADTVAPLLVKLHKNGTLSISQWLADFVLNELTTEERTEIAQRIREVDAAL